MKVRIREEDVRQVQDDPAQGRGAGDLRQPQAQAAPGLRDSEPSKEAT